jgi:hypothetical protein
MRLQTMFGATIGHGRDGFTFTISKNNHKQLFVEMASPDIFLA